MSFPKFHNLFSWLFSDWERNWTSLNHLRLCKVWMHVHLCKVWMHVHLCKVWIQTQLVGLTLFLYFAFLDTAEISKRITHYLSEANTVLHLPIAEAMVTYKGKGYVEFSNKAYLQQCFVSSVSNTSEFEGILRKCALKCSKCSKNVQILIYDTNRLHNKKSILYIATWISQDNIICHDKCMTDHVFFSIIRMQQYWLRLRLDLSV